MDERYQGMVVHKSCIPEWDFNNLELYMRDETGSCLHNNHKSEKFSSAGILH